MTAYIDQRSWLEKTREILGFGPSRAEVMRRIDYICAGGDWPPAPSAAPLPPRMSQPVLATDPSVELYGPDIGVPGNPDAIL